MSPFFHFYDSYYFCSFPIFSMGKGTAESTLCALFKNPGLFRNFLYGSFESGFLQLSLECFQLLCRHTGNLDCHLFGVYTLKCSLVNLYGSRLDDDCLYRLCTCKCLSANGLDAGWKCNSCSFCSICKSLCSNCCNLLRDSIYNNLRSYCNTLLCCLW